MGGQLGRSISLNGITELAEGVPCPTRKNGIGFLINQAPITGPSAKPMDSTPVKRAKMVAREPGDVQSAM